MLKPIVISANCDMNAMHQSEQYKLIRLRFRTCGKIFGVSMPSSVISLLLWVEYIAPSLSFLFPFFCQIWPTLVQEEDEYVE